jgi:hypothetical protein
MEKKNLDPACYNCATTTLIVVKQKNSVHQFKVFFNAEIWKRINCYEIVVNSVNRYVTHGTPFPQQGVEENPRMLVRLFLCKI